MSGPSLKYNKLGLPLPMDASFISFVSMKDLSLSLSLSLSQTKSNITATGIIRAVKYLKHLNTYVKVSSFKSLILNSAMQGKHIVFERQGN